MLITFVYLTCITILYTCSFQIIEDFNLKPRRDYSGLLDPVPYIQLSFLERTALSPGQIVYGALILAAMGFIILMTILFVVMNYEF